MYLPRKGRRPPRGEDSVVSVLEGACRGLIPRRKLRGPSTDRAPGSRSGEWRCHIPGAATRTLGQATPAVWSSGPRWPGHKDIGPPRGRLDLEPRFNKGAFPQSPGAAQRTFSGKKENPAPYDRRDGRWPPFEGASEPGAACRSRGARQSRRHWPAGTRKPTSPAPTVFTRSIVPNRRVPAPRTIRSSGDQKTTISWRTARSAAVRS